MDKSVVKAFSLFPSENGNANANANGNANANLLIGNSQLKQSTLFGFLNNCQTLQGMRLLRQWLNQPLLDKKHISK